jgi:hypothetical protein
MEVWLKHQSTCFVSMKPRVQTHSHFKKKKAFALLVLGFTLEKHRCQVLLTGHQGVVFSGPAGPQFQVVKMHIFPPYICFLIPQSTFYSVLWICK